MKFPIISEDNLLKRNEIIADPETVKSQKELAKVLKVSEKTIYHWVKKGMPIKQDGEYCVKDVMAWRALTATEEIERLYPEAIRDSNPSVVGEVIETLGKFRHMVEDYKINRADLLAGTGAKILNITERILQSLEGESFDKINVPDRIKVLKDMVNAITVLFEKERLERGQSTENVAVIVQAIKDLKRREINAPG